MVSHSKGGFFFFIQRNTSVQKLLYLCICTQIPHWAYSLTPARFFLSLCIASSCASRFWCTFSYSSCRFFSLLLLSMPVS